MLYQYLSFLCFLGNQLLVALMGGCLDLHGLPWSRHPQHGSALSLRDCWLLSGCQTHKFLSYSPSSKLCSNCRKLSIPVLVLLWALYFNWSYDDDVIQIPVMALVQTLRKDFSVVHPVRIGYVFLLVNLILLIDSK